MRRFLGNLLRVELVVIAIVVLVALFFASGISLYWYLDDGRWATRGDFKAVFGLHAVGLVPATLIFAPLLALYCTVVHKPHVVGAAVLGAVPALVLWLLASWDFARPFLMLGVPVAIATHFALGLTQRISRSLFSATPG